jgi:D-serine deaminase-like pyridoxal phosphate-dependent protein
MFDALRHLYLQLEIMTHSTLRLYENTRAFIETLEGVPTPTPALVLDGNVINRNAQRMATHVAGYGLSLRPHAKTDKSEKLARLQVAHGASGLKKTTV